MIHHSSYIPLFAAAIITIGLTSCSDNSPNGLFKQLVAVLKTINDKDSADKAAPEIKDLFAKLKASIDPKDQTKQFENLIDPETRKEFEEQMGRIVGNGGFGSKELEQAFQK